MTVDERVRNTPSNPKPNSVVWISWLYFLLTVVTKSENTSGAFQEIHAAEKFHFGDGEQIPR